MIPACGGGEKKTQQETDAEAKLEAARSLESKATTPEEIKAAREARETAEQNLKEATRAGDEVRAKALLEKEDRKITQEKYHKVETGMTYNEVHNIVGAHGEELSRVEFGGVTTACISWMNDDGSNMLLTFQGGRVVSKAQAGLRPESSEVKEARKKVDKERARRAEAERQANAKAADEARAHKEEEARRRAEQQAREAVRNAPQLLNQAQQSVEEGKAANAKDRHEKASNHFQQAVERCEEIIGTAPQTPAAAKAKGLLAEAKKLLAAEKAEVEGARKLVLAKKLAEDCKMEKLRGNSRACY
jgi:fused signal recognition particle receptor